MNKEKFSEIVNKDSLTMEEFLNDISEQLTNDKTIDNAIQQLYNSISEINEDEELLGFTIRTYNDIVEYINDKFDIAKSMADMFINNILDLNHLDVEFAVEYIAFLFKLNKIANNHLAITTQNIVTKKYNEIIGVDTNGQSD